MHTEMYKTFVALAKTLSFSVTAEQMNVVQSTVSSRINELEKYLDQSLFKRTKRSVELTHAGKLFLPYAENIIRQETLGIETLNTMSLYEDRLKLCIVGSLYKEKLATVINAFYKKYPQYEIDIELRITELQLEMLLDSEVDIGFINRKTSSRKICVKPYLDYQIIFVAPMDYPIDEEITVEDLRGIDFALSSGSKRLQEYYSEIMPKYYRTRLKLNSTVQMVEYVKKGYGCAFLQDFLVQGDIDNGLMRQVRIKGVKPLKLTSYIAINKLREKSTVVQRFLELIPELDEYQYNI